MRFLTPPRFWFLTAWLVATVRLSEHGLSLDPALFSAVARNIAENGGWWSPRASDTLFPFFYVHPFLGLWGQAVVFKLFGANDLTARLFSVLLGCGCFAYLYRLGDLLGGSRLGHALAVVTLFTIPFMGRLATFYLDVPMTFFLIAALYYYVRAITLRETPSAALSGLCLGLAFLVKGLAALPMIPTLVVIGALKLRGKLIRDRSLFICLGLCVVVVAAFCALQDLFGTESFWRVYLYRHFLGHTMPQGSRTGPWPLLWRFVREHPLHLLIAIAAIGVAAKDRQWRLPIAIGWAGGLIFLAANARLGVPHLHYLHPIYPLINLPVACALCAWFPSWNWQRIASALLVVGLLYQAVWHVLPIPMRKKPESDYFQLRGMMLALREKGVTELQGVNLSDSDWVYLEMSLWYWKLPTRMVAAADANARAIVVKASEDAERSLSDIGYRPCVRSERLAVYLKQSDEAVPLCDGPPFDRTLLR